ncbi:MAG: hypothetical protein HOP19_23120 [Acidobacteria bacterium]|nr:hypothetical protein [Acidobacteriota bacterium]
MTLSALLGELLLLFHVFLFVIWLGSDLVVFSLSMSLRNRALPIAVRLDRSHIAEQLDFYVLVSYVLAMPTGLALAYLRGWWPIASIPWLMAKLIVFGVVVILAVVLVLGASHSGMILKKIAAGEGDVEALENQLRSGIHRLAPWALAIHLSILLTAFVALSPRGWW